jgi:KAP family P-loop domain
VKFRVYIWRSLTWLLAGSLLGIYLPDTPLSKHAHEIFARFVALYPPVLYGPAFLFLFMVGLRPLARLMRRYRNNWKTRGRLFTVFDGGVFLIAGSLFSIVLNDSLPLRRSAYTDPELSALLICLSGIVFLLLSAVFISYRLRPEEALLGPTDDLVDVPITDEKQDILGRERFVSDFYAQIKRFPSEDSFVFGLNGSWGTGKTSVLNLLRNKLRGDDSFILVDFNPWYFHSPDAIIRRFYDAMAEAINREFFYPELKSTARRYARILAPVLKPYGIDLGSMETGSVEEAKATVESFILRTGRTVVLIVDDLDRSSPDEIMTTLQTVRLSANFRRTIFVLAYDLQQLTDQIWRKGIPGEYLDKIVQYPIDLPAADKEEIDRFIIFSDSEGHVSHLDKLLNNLHVEGPRRKDFDQHSVEAYYATLGSFFPTLRAAKRFLTGLTVRLPAVLDEVHLLDFVMLEVIRVFSNSLYQDIWNNPYYYIPSWSTRSLISSPFGLESSDKDKNSRRQAIKAHIESLLKDDPRAPNVISVLKKLFPLRVGDAFDRHPGFGDGLGPRLRAAKRLTHPECFDKYFLLEVPRRALGDATVQSMLRSWEKAANPEEAISSDLDKVRASGKLIETIERMLVFLADINKSIVTTLFRAVVRRMISVPLDQGSTEQTAQIKFFLYLLDERIPASEKQSEAEWAVSSVEGIDVAVRMLVPILQDQSSVNWHLRTTLKIEPLTAIILNRFVRDFVEPRRDVFESNNPAYVLFQIGSYGADAAKVVNDYLFDLFAEKPQYVGRLISGFSMPIDEQTNSFNFEHLKSVYDVKRWVTFIEEHGPEVWSNSKEERAVQTFLKFCKSSDGFGESVDSTHEP